MVKAIIRKVVWLWGTPTLAIIYMNELDEQIIHKSGGAASLKRFIDDIFAVLTSDKINEDKLFEISNSLSDAIKFTIELPEDNRLPFLDTLVSFDHSNKKFSTELYYYYHNLLEVPILQ